MSAFKGLIKQALRNGEFRLYYQPIVNLQTNQIAGSEALIRWHSPIEGLLMPVDFIPECELDPYLMVEICEFVIRQSSRDRKKLPKGFISVNIAPSSLEMRRFWSVLEEYSLINDYPVLFLEITERLLTNYKAIAPYVKRRKGQFVGAFIDDWGVGEASYIQVAEILKWFPSHAYVKVKLDIEFARHLKESTYRWFAKSIIDSMHGCPSGKIEVIAEGIEYEWQRQVFLDLGCDYGQGWLWGQAEAI